MMSRLASALNWYQKKIGAYDKQSWEKTVDQRILRGVCAVPKKTARIKTELIDVDLVRGSAFPKAKPQHSWIAATLSGVIRVLFLPFYFTWWKLQTCILVTSVFLILYILQIIVMYFYFFADETEFIDVPASETLMPAAMMLILGIVQSQIVATFSSKSSHKQVTRTKRKRLKRKTRTKVSLDYETKSSPETASEDKSCSIEKHNNISIPNERVNNEVVKLPAGQQCDNICDTCRHFEKAAAKCCQVICSCKHDSPIINHKAQRKKNCSDDESGLDDLDFTQPVEAAAQYFEVPIACKVHHDSGYHENHSENSLNANDLCSCQKLNPSKSPNQQNNSGSAELSNSNTISPPEMEADAGNISSGEEYFVAKKPAYTPEQWKHYLFELKNNSSICKHYDKKDFVKTNCLIFLRRYSDVGPSQKSKSKSHLSLPNFDHGYSDGVLGNFGDHYLTKDVHKHLSQIKSSKNINMCCNVCHDSLNRNLRNRKGIRPSLEFPVNFKKSYSSCESGAETTSPNTPTRPQTSDLEWPLITNTDCNSDSSDCSSQSSHEDESNITPSENPFAWEMQEAPPSSFNVGYPGSDKVSCTIWEHNECKKVDLTVLDISSAIIKKVDSSLHSTEYLTVGLLLAVVISFLPLLFRLHSGTIIEVIQDVTSDVMHWTVPNTDHIFTIIQDLLSATIGSKWRVKAVVLIALLERFILSLTYFFLLSVAEKTFKQRFLYAKHFCHLTSSRRARRSELPHFRLNKVRNIKTWLSVRSYLKKLGPQRSVDVIVSIAFILEVCILSFLCVQLLKESGQFTSQLACWETLYWTLALGFYLLRFMILGSKINKKYRNLSVLITEQINLYLHMEQKPHKKEELMLANSVLKLAADLLKELESPFKISGLCANPYLYNITKVVVLSAFSAVLTEVLGFKLKLYKIKIK